MFSKVDVPCYLPLRVYESSIPISPRPCQSVVCLFHSRKGLEEQVIICSSLLVCELLVVKDHFLLSLDA